MNPREMERYNPFAAEQPPANDADADLKQAYSSPSRQPQPFLTQQQQRTSTEQATGTPDQTGTPTGGRYSTSFPDPFGLDDHHQVTSSSSSGTGRFSAATPPSSQPASSRQTSQAHHQPSNRSNSVTFLHRIGDDDQQRQQQQQQADSGGGHRSRTSQRGSRQPGGASGGFTSFLSRATSVTSSSVTDRVSGAVGSVRNAVDSLSSQIQQAVPSSSNLISSSFNQDPQTASGTSVLGSDKQQQQSAASYLASRLSSATNQFVGSSSTAASHSNIAPSSSSFQAGQLEGPTATICRQRVVLILDGPGGTDWAQQFIQYRRLVSGLAPQSSASLAFTSFFADRFSSATGGSGSGGQTDDGDLIEQVNFKDASVLANQSSATAAVFVSGPSAAPSSLGSSSTSSLPINRLALNIVSGSSSSQQQQQQMQQHHNQLHHNQQQPNTIAKTIRPEYVVVRQRGREHLGHLKSIVKALDYCCVPMFEPYEVWNVFQDRQQIFAKLLRVQHQLGKENFPLIPQVFCQTHQDLLNYINNSFVSLPCLVRTGPFGKGKIRIDNLQMLKDFATIMATSEQSCTIEQYLDVKCDLIVQKLGTSLKLFKGKFVRKSSLANQAAGGQADSTSGDQQQQQQQKQQQQSRADSDNMLFGHQQQSRSSLVGQDSFGRQSASRQTSLGSNGGGGGGGLFGGLIPTGGGNNSQLTRHNSNPTATSGGQANFEKLSEVNSRYRRWVEAIMREFDNKIDVFCIKIVVASNDREYIVGLRNCSMEFLGNQENQEEDRRSLVELIISKMNTILPKHQPISRDSSASANCGPERLQRGLMDDATDTRNDMTTTSATATNLMGSKTLPGRLGGGGGGSPSDKRATFLSHGNGATVGSQPSMLRYGASQEAPTHHQNNQSSASNANQMLNNRNRSVSMNQGEPMRPLGQAEWNQAANKQQSPLATGSSLGQSYLPRRGSERSESMLANNEDYSQVDSPGGLPESSNARQMSLGQSFFDQTSTALSSFQRQSLSFLRRLDTRTGAEFASGSGSGTPPLSAKSDTVFDRVYGGGSGPASSNGPGSLEGTSYGSGVGGGGPAPSIPARASVKSQSVDAHPVDPSQRPAGAHPPPKPPPPAPASFINRQSSLANYSSTSMNQQRASLSQHQRVRSESSTTNPITPQNSINQSSFSDEQQQHPRGAVTNGASGNQPQQQRQQQRVVRQNSALSAFEPFDASLRSETYQESDQPVRNKETGGAAAAGPVAQTNANLSGVGAPPTAARQLYDTASMKSANSNTSDETTTAEDTMNNLKRTFASIFGDKCE